MSIQEQWGPELNTQYITQRGLIPSKTSTKQPQLDTREF